MCSRKNNSCLGPSEASQRCTITVGNSICGEANSLDIMKEFNRLYEERMEQVDSDAGGDCLQEKVRLQSEWIKNLIQQNEMLVKAVQELEIEATERVQHLEEKLQKSAESLCQVIKKYREHDFAVDLLEEPLQKISHLEDDIKNVLEFIRRIREDGKWNTDGLFFYNITRDELLGPKCKCYTKNQFNFPDQGELSEGEKMLNEKERTVHELTQRVNYYNSFGDLEALAKELQSRRIECDTLKQDMIDIRQALTEEVALKYDQIIALRKDVQILEDRCLQADEQTAFKEDIIRELRKEIKQLKQQTSFLSEQEKSSLQSKIDKLNLENTTLKETLSVDKHHVEELDAQFKSFLQERDELKKKLKAAEKKAKKDKDTLHCECEVLREEIKKLKAKNAQLQIEVESSRQSLHQVTCESAGCKERMDAVLAENRKILEQIISLNEENRNLSQSIDVLRQRSEYTNSFTHDEISKLNLTIDELRHNLEKTRMIQEDEEKAHENEISMLQSTIDNLEQNIKILKEKYEKDTKTCKICRGRSKVGFLETSEVQVNIESKESELLKVANDLKSNMKLEIDKKDSEIQCLKNKVSELEQTANLQETVANELKSNMKIEADKKNAEIRSLKNKITELEVALTTCEERAANLQEADQLKKLSKQKKCYEDIIGYFKNEMAVMAEQLNNLQELLTLSNASAHQESSKIMQAFMEVQTINEKLSNQLCACEQKVQLESQMNQIHEAKICELQQLVSEKEINLSKHDETMLNIRKTLNDSLKQNADLQLTIVELNETINSLQDAIKTYEYENCASKRSCLEFQQQIGSYCCKLEDVKKDLEDKTAECLKLEMAYNNEKRALKAAQKQLQETERLQQENQRELVSSVEEMKEKLQQGEDSIKKLCCECENLQGQLANLSRKEAVKDLEIKRYRKIVTDLKTTMMELNTELNKNLAQKDIKSTCKNASCRKNFDKDETKPQDICLSCPCEVEFYQKMVDMLKKSVTELKRKLSDTQEANKALEEQLREKSSQLAQALKAKEELERRLSFGQLNDRRICELECENDRLKQELQMKSLQLTDVKRSANDINESKCMQLACAQEEISNLKNDMTNILNRQYNLKRENEELQSQMAELNCNNNCLNEKNKMLKEQIEQNLMRIKNLNAEKETLLRKNKELVYELRSFQSMTCTTDKHHRLTSDSLKQLEADIEGLKSNKEDICFESKNMIKYVRAWVTEQKKINSFIAKREQEYIDALKQKTKDTPCPIQRPPARISKSNRAGPCNNMCASPCSLGSQGVASFYDEESPIPSPDLGMNNDWYSTTFRAESDDNESEEDYCVNTLEHLTQQMRKSNRFWKSESCRSKKDCRVTKDIKK
ncbi:interaptin-like isoform X9 [Anthonomus grandis grandis]|uniref:interaptin-like isoform X9 n=1 Tax=Anthonomus grandis grandis TaxID=2921223 RepID=UPI002165C547|nr:interaptin-like isoform X9 [Anthonomus grandis grandis]